MTIRGRNASALWLFLTLAFTALALAGCNKAVGSHSAAHDAEFKVALLVPGPVSDAGWNASAFKGLMLIKTRMKAHTAMVQTQSPADFEDSMRDFASRGFKLIFAHGFEYTDAAIKVARYFPHTTFVVTSGSATASNVATLTFRIEQAAYVEGVLAGAASKTGIAGAVGGIELPAIRLTFNAFRRGFMSVRPNGKVLISYTGNFNDVGAAREAAAAQIGQGADMLFQDADAAGLGVFEAASAANVFAFGANGNQNHVAPDAVMASAVTDIPGAFLKIAREVKADDFHPAKLEYGMREGMVHVIYNKQLLRQFPALVYKKALAAQKAIVNGRITIALARLPLGMAL